MRCGGHKPCRIFVAAGGPLALDGTLHNRTICGLSVN